MPEAEDPIEWMLPDSYSVQGVPRAWKLHAVRAKATDTGRDVRFRRAACGLRTARGWTIDLFVEQRCSRCLRALGLAHVPCKGRGVVGYASCQPCRGTGIAPVDNMVPPR